MSYADLTAAPDYALQQAQIQRQQQLAQTLSQMGNEPIQAQSAGGITAPISPLSALAKALNSFGGAYLAGQATTQGANLQSQEGKDALKAINALYQPGPSTTSLAPNVTDQPQSLTVSAPQIGGNAPMPDTTVQLQQPTLGTPQATTTPGPPPNYQQQQQMINAMSVSDNPMLQKIAPELAAQIKPQYMEQAPGQTLLQSQNGTVTPTGISAPLLPTDQQRNWLTAGPPGSAAYNAARDRDLYGIQTPTEVAQKVAEANQIHVNNITAGQNVPMQTGTNGMAIGTTGDPLPHPEAPGYSTIPVPGAGGLTQAEIDKGGMQMAMGEGLPSGMGLGSTGPGGARKTAIMNRSAELDPTGNLVANKGQVKALNTALTNTTNQGTQISTALNNAANESNQLIGAFNGKVNTSIPLANIFANAANYQLDPTTISSYRAGLTDLAATYSQVFARNGQQTDQTRQMAKDIADGNISIDALQSVLGQVNTQGNIIVQGYQKQRQNLQSQYKTILSGGQAVPNPGGGPPPPATQPTTKVIGGVTYTSPDGGKTWFH